MDITIQLLNLVKDYRGGRNKKIHALAGVSLDIARGEIFSLLGPNGAGKTTMVKVLLGIAFPSSGSGTLLGKPLGDTATKTRIGYLPENHRFPNYLTGEQVLRYFGTLTGMHGALLETRIAETMTIVNMQEWGRMKIRKYSKGMLQRIGLAQAMLNNPEIIFLDEPTDGVDPIGRKEIRQTLVRIKEQGATIFLNSHLLSEVERISDRVAIMNKGKILRTGSVEDLTNTNHEYVITIEGDPKAAVAAIGNRATSIKVEQNQLTLRVDSIADLNAITDALRAASVNIAEIAKRHESLEDAFINLIEQVD